MIRCLTSVVAYLLLFSSPAFAWVVSAGFEGGTVGTRAESPNPDAFDEAAEDSKYVDSPVLTGNQAGSVSINQGEEGFGDWGGILNFPTDLGEGDELWFRVNVYYPQGWEFRSVGEGLKFMRVATGANEGFHTVLIKGDTTGGLVYVNSEVNGDDIFDDNGPYPWPALRNLGTDVVRDQWTTYEMYLKFSSVRGEGIYRVWQDENLLFEGLETATLKTANSTSSAAYLYTNWNDGAPRTQRSYVDDILITNETPGKVDAFGNPMIGMPVPEPTTAALFGLAAISLLARRHRPRR